MAGMRSYAIAWARFQSQPSDFARLKTVQICCNIIPLDPEFGRYDFEHALAQLWSSTLLAEDTFAELDTECRPQT
ncbi:hypothetical protein PHLCEN_2v11280 [Hermanssonia centrifuga]|uniref:Uncharacterized protein n=1 Tax=Hermanssonia centrifuga TaxID=98765 RepID=A0A2R6NKG5_9APHY|nr:hypothetical protein PHLCEN_2v11280 [Hermanssonia centrifuga]